MIAVTPNISLHKRARYYSVGASFVKNFSHITRVAVVSNTFMSVLQGDLGMCFECKHERLGDV